MLLCILSLFGVLLFVFFFKQKTAYEMRISDWSSDVCSSDLIRKGAMDAVLRYAATQASADLTVAVERIAKSGGTPLVVSVDRQNLGDIHLKDIVKNGIRERFAETRRMGIRTVLITSDHPLTAAAIAAEAGVHDFIAAAAWKRVGRGNRGVRRG